MNLVPGFTKCELCGQGPVCGGLGQDISVPGLGELHGGGQEETALRPQQGRGEFLGDYSQNIMTNEIYFQVTDESLKEVERILARSEAPGATATTTSNIRPGYKPSIKPLIDNNLNGSTSYRSEIFKTKVKFFNISAPGHCLTQLTTASPGCRRQQRPGRVCGGSP